MRKNLTTNIMILLVLALLAFNVFAATPGAACYLYVTGPLGLRVVDPGYVNPTGRACGPTDGYVLNFPLGAGVNCGSTIKIANISVRASCPN